MGRSVGLPFMLCSSSRSAGRSVCGALEASAHNVVIKLPRDHFDLRLNKGGSGSSHREGGREKRSQFVPPSFLPPCSLSLPFLFCIAPLSIENVQSDTHSNVGRRRAHFAYCRSLPSVFEATPGAASLLLLLLLLQRDKWPNSRSLSLPA